MRVLIDTNIVLDFLLQREPFFQDTDLLFQANDSDRVVGHVTATTLTDIFYIARRHTHSVEQARQVISETLTNNRTSMPQHLQAHWFAGGYIWGLFWLRPSATISRYAEEVYTI